MGGDIMLGICGLQSRLLLANLDYCTRISMLVGRAGGTNGSMPEDGGKGSGVDSKVLQSVAAALQGNSLAQAMENMASKAQNGDDA